MDWRPIGNKPLLKSMLAQFTDTYMRRLEEMSLKEQLFMFYLNMMKSVLTVADNVLIWSSF